MKIFQPTTGGGGGGGVTSLNSLTGAVTLSAGTNIALTPVGNDIEISSTAGNVTGTGALGRATFWTGVSTISSSVDFLFNDSTKDFSAGDLNGSASGARILILQNAGSPVATINGGGSEVAKVYLDGVAGTSRLGWESGAGNQTYIITDDPNMTITSKLGGIYSVINASSLELLRVDAGNNLAAIGDYLNAANGNSLWVEDASQAIIARISNIFRVTDVSNNNLFYVDETNKVSELGDIALLDNGTRLSISWNTDTISNLIGAGVGGWNVAEIGVGKFFNFDSATYTSYIGDGDSTNNGTAGIFDDTNQNITLRSDNVFALQDSSGNKFIENDRAAFTLKVGDTGGFFTGDYTLYDYNAGGTTHFVSFLSMKNVAGTEQFFFGDPAQNLIEMGDVGGTGTLLHFNYTAGVQDTFQIGKTVSAAYRKIINLDLLNYNAYLGDNDGATLTPASIELNSSSGGRITFTGGQVSKTITSVNYGTTTNLTVSHYDLQIGAGGSGATTVNLPTSTINGTTFIIKDYGCNASGNNITVDAGSGNSIKGSSSAQTFVMATNGQAIRLKQITDTISGSVTWSIE